MNRQNPNESEHPFHSAFVIRHFLGITAALLLLAAPLPSWSQTSTNRPAAWAQRLEIIGVENCYQVTTNLYRGAQPTFEGMTHLQKHGIRLIVNLRMLRNDHHELHGTSIKHLDVNMVPWHATTADVVQFLKAVTNTNNQPVFVHCERGADRTGFMCAMYRIAVCGWAKEDAIAEMKEGGFHFSPVWQNLISFIEKADIADIRRRAGLAKS